MSKRESLKDQLKKAAKKRLARNSSFPGSRETTDNQSNDLGRTSEAVVLPGAYPVSMGAGGKTAATKALDLIINTLLALDNTREDLNDRAILVGLKSVLRGYAANEPNAAAVYDSIIDARKQADIQTRPWRDAIDQLLEIVTAYGSNRDTPRAALTYLHSVAS